MKLFYYLFLLFFSCGLFASPFQQPAHRIIALAPNLTEIIFAAGAGKSLVGVDSMSNYPSAAQKIPVIANFQTVDLEKIAKLHPDLIVAWQYTNSLIIEQLRRLNLPIYQASFNKISDIPKVIQVIGRLAGSSQVANRNAQQFQQELENMTQRYAAKKPVTVFYQLSQQPLMTVNRHSLVNQVILLCGGQNVFENTTGLAPIISIENILKENPAVILVSAFEKPNLKFWNQYPQLIAVQKKQIYSINPDLVERPSPRILQGAAIICRDLEVIRRSRAVNDQ